MADPIKAALRVARFPAPTPENRRRIGCHYRPDDKSLCWCGHRFEGESEFGTCPECIAAVEHAAREGGG